MSESDQTAISQNRGVIRAAMLLSLGNIVSRILGLVRETVKANLFGASGLLSAFTVATYVPMSIFQLIVGGEMVSSSLVPVFSDYANKEDRRELWEVVSVFLSLAILVLAISVGIIMATAPFIANALGANQFDDTTLQPLAVRWMRLAAPAVLFLSLASLMTGVLYALKRFTAPAFTAAILNGSFITGAYLLGSVEGLVWGLLAGSLLQILIQLPALRDANLRWLLAWKHPALRRILLLYAPIVVGLLINQASVGASYRLANGLGDRSVALMGFGTTLIQFPLGLVGTALSIAILPTLSEQATRDLSAFKTTLAGGIRLVSGLILPAAAGLFALAVPIIALLFESGEFSSADTQEVAAILRVYLIGLPFAAVDQMLVFASYARKDTWRPALVGVISIVFYWIAALLLVDRIGLLCLMVADAVKHIVHTAIMIGLLQRQLGGLAGQGILPMIAKALLGSTVTGIAAYFVAQRLGGGLLPANTVGDLLLVALAGGLGVAIYMAFVYGLNMRDVKSLLRLRR